MKSHHMLILSKHDLQSSHQTAQKVKPLTTCHTLFFILAVQKWMPTRTIYGAVLKPFFVTPAISTQIYDAVDDAKISLQGLKRLVFPNSIGVLVQCGLDLGFQVSDIANILNISQQLVSNHSKKEHTPKPLRLPLQIPNDLFLVYPCMLNLCVSKQLAQGSDEDVYTPSEETDNTPKSYVKRTRGRPKLPDRKQF